MNEKNKNVLIGGLLAIVLVMAVGYAAFATQLNINGTAEITSKWDVRFDNTKTTTMTPTTGLTGATAPTGTISYSSDDLTATLKANLTQPGDAMLFTLTIKNDGTLNAKNATPVLTLNGGEVTGLVATKGNIKFTVTEPTPATIDAGSTATMTVKAEFTEPGANAVTGNETAELGVTISYTQA